MVSRGNHRRDWWTCPGKGGTWWWLARCVVGPTNVASNNQQTRWSRKEIRIRVQIHTCVSLDRYAIEIFTGRRIWLVQRQGLCRLLRYLSPLFISHSWFLLLLLLCVTHVDGSIRIQETTCPRRSARRGWIGSPRDRQPSTDRVHEASRRWPETRRRPPAPPTLPLPTLATVLSFAPLSRRWAPVRAWISDWPLIVAAKCERSVLRSRDLSQSCANGD